MPEWKFSASFSVIYTEEVPKLSIVNRFNWTYIADNGARHHVGLMHGPQSGHLLVYCNSRIMLIDFKILQNKTYSFFIEEELCELSIERKGDQFFYGFEPNIKADTPLNRERNKVKRKELFQSIAVLGALLIAIIVGSALIYYTNQDINNPSLKSQLNTMGKETHARILMSPEPDQKKVQYFFIVDGRPYTVETSFKEGETPILLDTGMPLQVGDEFLVKYLPGNPLLHSIAYDQPSKGTLEAYRDRAIETFRKSNPGTSNQYSNCLAEVAYSTQGIKGLALMYSSKTSRSDNLYFNANAFEEMMKDDAFLMAMNKQCK